MLTFIWHSAVGLILILVALTGAVLTLARAIGKGAEHDRERCECGECSQIRRRRGEKIIKYSPHLKPYDRNRPNRDGGEWLTTYQLHTGLRVTAKGMLYEVRDLVGSEYGIRVHLTAMETGRRTMVMIPFVSLSKKLWRRAD